MYNFLKIICLIRHNFKVVHDNGCYIYQECERCGARTIEIEHLSTKMPNYAWVRRETNTI